MSDTHCMRFGLTKNLVLPLPEPPIINTFLLRAYAGFFGRLLIVSRSVCVRITLLANTGSIKGLISSGVPHEAFCQVLF